MFSASLAAPPFSDMVIAIPEAVNPYEAIWNATCGIESNNNPMAFCIDVNGLPSVGIAQIQESRIIDFNRSNGTHLRLKDCFDPAISKRIFMFYASGDNEQIARCWNGGNRGMRKEGTKKYYLKIQKALLSL
jgi:hypothetical protein